MDENKSKTHYVYDENTIYLKNGERKVGFLSHAANEKSLALQLDEVLERYNQWMILYERDFDSRTDFVSEITDALVDSDYVICLISKHFLTSTWCVKELDIAFASQKLIPVLVEDCDLSSLPISMDQVIDIRTLDHEQALSMIIDNLDTRISRVASIVLDRNKTYSYIERLGLVIFKYDVDEAESNVQDQWSSRIYNSIEQILDDNNVKIIYHSKPVKSRKEAQTIMQTYNADVGLYGLIEKYSAYTSIIFSRGWKLEFKEFFATHWHPTTTTLEQHLDNLYVRIFSAFILLDYARNRHKTAMDIMRKLKIQEDDIFFSIFFPQAYGIHTLNDISLWFREFLTLNLPKLRKF